MPNNPTDSVGAVMVLYEPDWDVTGKAIEALAPQVNMLCIVDNTPQAVDTGRFAPHDNVHYIPLNANKGIAAAQNEGARFLLNQGMSFLLFSDQDTLAPENLVAGLMEDYKILEAENCNVGLIGPVPVNKVTGQPYTSKVRAIKEIECHGRKLTECQYIISSYSLIPSSSIKKGGEFMEKLFVDFVDNEWCFRLHHRTGLSPYISRRLAVSHELGKSKKFLGKQINVSSPFRLYFQIRNYFLVKKLEYIPADWLKGVRNKLIPKLLFYPIVPKDRCLYMKSIVRGLRDGLKS